jgi:hypothetical protein
MVVTEPLSFPAGGDVPVDESFPEVVAAPRVGAELPQAKAAPAPIAESAEETRSREKERRRDTLSSEHDTRQDRRSANEAEIAPAAQ